jgi:hypothetical protein
LSRGSARSVDFEQSEELENRRSALSDALSVLNDSELRIFEPRRLVDGPVTLQDLGTEFGVSRERIRQIERRAFEKVRTFVGRASSPFKGRRHQPSTGLSTSRTVGAYIGSLGQRRIFAQHCGHRSDTRAYQWIRM